MSGFLPKKGNYRELLTYKKSLIIYDATYLFCQRFLQISDRTIDQMVQAARSGKQNIIEASKAAVTSAETEIKLTNVARASLEELLEDYYDFLRVRNITPWNKNSKEALFVRNLAYNPNESSTTYKEFFETRSSDICANIIICLINQCNYLLDRQIRKLESDFTKSGGIREQMFEARKRYRKSKNNDK